MNSIEFDYLLNIYQKEYDSNIWYYSGDDNNIRYILGEKGEHPLIIIGINPSTAKPNNLDPTLRQVRKKAIEYGYDSYIMMNIYPERTNNPKLIHKSKDFNIHEENLKAFKYIFDNISNIEIWAAWGANIEKRKYLFDCLKDIISLSKGYSVKWMKRGNWKHPHHPLYLSDEYKLESFDIDKYIMKKNFINSFYN